MKLNALQQLLDRRHEAHLYRTRQILEQTQGVISHHQGQTIVNFCSSNYLSLAQHPDVTAAFQKGITQFGAGSGASHLVCGHTRPHHTLEEAFADFTGYPRALLFPNGYLANLGVLQALSGAQDRIYQDHDNHASLLDAGQLSRAKSQRYLHLNIESLNKHLQKPIAGQRLIVSDTVFSMHGDIAPLPDLVQSSQRYNCLLIADDAHGIGVLGATGRGALEHFNLSHQDIDVLVCPLSKAFGCYGALVAGHEVIIENLIQFARSYIYTTALPAAMAMAALASLNIIRHESWRRQRLNHLINFFKQEACIRNLPLTSTLNSTPTVIQSIIIDNSQQAIHLADSLLKAGFLVRAMRPPTVSKPLLRITLNLDHTEQQIIDLLDKSYELLQEIPSS